MPDEERPAARRLHPALVEAVCVTRELHPDPENLPETEEDLVALALAGADWEEPDEMQDRLVQLLQTLLQMRDPRIAVGIAVREYAYKHADAAQMVEGRLIFSDNLLRFVVSLVEPGGPGEGLSVAELAYLSGVSEDTLEEWLRAPSGGSTSLPRNLK